MVLEEKMIRKIITYPDPILLKISDPVAKPSPEIRTLLADMAETMYAHDGVGLAAPQVAISLRVIVVDISSDADDEKGKILYKMVNPEITYRGGEIEWEEGCLSVPDCKVKITRSAELSVRYLDDTGAEKTLSANGLLAVAIQHEIDHLDGKVILDSASRLKRELYLKKIKKQSQKM